VTRVKTILTAWAVPGDNRLTQGPSSSYGWRQDLATVAATPQSSS
jgi:hypothetical protein